jgi:hypothetical protein
VTGAAIKAWGDKIMATGKLNGEVVRVGDIEPGPCTNFREVYIVNKRDGTFGKLPKEATPALYYPMGQDLRMILDRLEKNGTPFAAKTLEYWQAQSFGDKMEYLLEILDAGSGVGVVIEEYLADPEEFDTTDAAAAKCVNEACYRLSSTVPVRTWFDHAAVHRWSYRGPDGFEKHQYRGPDGFCLEPAEHQRILFSLLPDTDALSDALHICIGLDSSSNSTAVREDRAVSGRWCAAW